MFYIYEEGSSESGLLPSKGILSGCFFLLLFKRTHAALFLRARPTLYMRLECDVQSEAARVSWLFRVNPDSLPAVNPS